MADSVKTETAPGVLDPQNSGPFEAGKEVPLGGQPFSRADMTKNGLPAGDFQAAITEGIAAYENAVAAIQSIRDGLSNAPFRELANVRSTLSWLCNHLMSVEMPKLKSLKKV